MVARDRDRRPDIVRPQSVVTRKRARQQRAVGDPGGVDVVLPRAHAGEEHHGLGAVGVRRLDAGRERASVDAFSHGVGDIARRSPAAAGSPSQAGVAADVERAERRGERQRAVVDAPLDRDQVLARRGERQ